MGPEQSMVMVLMWLLQYFLCSCIFSNDRLAGIPALNWVVHWGWRKGSRDWCSSQSMYNSSCGDTIRWLQGAMGTGALSHVG